MKLWDNLPIIIGFFKTFIAIIKIYTTGQKKPQFLIISFCVQCILIHVIHSICGKRFSQEVELAMTWYSNNINVLLPY